MKRADIIFGAISLFALTLVGGSVMAQQHGPMGSGMGTMGHGMGMMGRGMGMIGGGDCPMIGMMMGSGEMPGFSEGRIAFLKAELAITAAQQSAWEAYAAALQKNLTAMQGMRQTMTTAMSGKTPVERLEAHVTAMEGRLAALKEVKPALDKLYAALSDDQKKKADQLLTGMGCMM